MDRSPKAETTRGHLKHRMPGRVRIVLDRPLPHLERLESLATALAAIPGIDSAEIRPTSGSIVIRHRGDFDELRESIAREGIQFASSITHLQPIDPMGAAARQLGTVDGAIARLTDGRADLWSLAFAGLVAGGVIQLARGSVAGPALTLLGQAATLTMARPLRTFIR
ncbi:hypothetical protein [Sphingobium aquiterrae]|uniref:hypothetical protein n=1 Tax=Sphingobium aquiterrae TaxID=2038656 RepID=UPI003015C7F2